MNTIESRALELLSAGVSQEATAAALGVTPSRISQLLAQDEFAAAVNEARFEQVQKHNIRDQKYDQMEDALLSKLDASLPLLFRPETILGALKIVNSAQRRGSGVAPVTQQQTVVNLLLPNAITQRFAVNINNQVIKAGEQDLITMKPGDLSKLMEVEEAQYESITYNGQSL